MSVEISVVIPMYNASEHIVKTLESCIHQNHLPKEIVVVDDCSHDDSFLKVREWKKNYRGTVNIVLERLVRNSGASVARNVGWERTTGNYIAFLDADDTFISTKIETVVRTLRKKRDIVLLANGYALHNESKVEENTLKKVSTHSLLKKNLFVTPSVTLRREIAERFDETMRYTEDHDLWLRVTQAYAQTYYLDKVLTVIDRPVRSEGGQSANLWAMRRGEIKMYRKYCKANKLMVLFPLFLGYSLMKHLLKTIKGRA